jgi:hypothetical protein
MQQQKITFGEMRGVRFTRDQAPIVAQFRIAVGRNEDALDFLKTPAGKRGDAL